MNAASDLDLIFVYDHADGVVASDGPRPIAPSQYFARTSHRLITALTVMTAEGDLYDVDMRLRPSGNKGPVAVSFETFSRYQAEDAWTWERLALTRARVICGPPDLCRRVESVIRTALTTDRDPVAVLADVANMRMRLDKERPAKSPWELKEARGGLFDIEFIVQGLQLVHGTAHTTLLSVNTLEALGKLLAFSVIDMNVGERLKKAAELYQSLTQILRLTIDGAFQPSEASESLRALIARAAGVTSFDEVEDLLRAVESDVREIFTKLVG